MPKYTDVSGAGIKVTTLDNSINKLAGIANAWAEKKYVQDKQLTLNLVESLTKNSSRFNDQSDFDAAFETLNAADEKLDDAVSQTLLDNMRITLDDEFATFEADKFITAGVEQTREYLKNLGPKDGTEGITEIIAILEEMRSSYRADASKSIQLSLDQAQEDVLASLKIVHKFNFHDDNPDDEIWRFKGKPLIIQDMHNAWLAKDFGEAEKLRKKAAYGEEEVIWDNIGDDYKGNLETMNLFNAVNTDNYKYRPAKSNIKKGDKDSGIFAYMGKIPTTGTQSINSHNLDDKVAFWRDRVITIMDDPSIDWNRNTEGEAIKKAFESGGIDNMWNTILDASARMANITGYVNLSPEERRKALTIKDIKDYLGTSVDWYDHGFVRDDERNRIGGETFFGQLGTYLSLMHGQTKLDELLGTSPMTSPESIHSNDPIDWDSISIP